MKLSLVVSQGNPAGKEIPIRQTHFLIGRDPDCQLRPASPLVSKRHCAILVRGEQVYVRDFGSTNGTLINQVQIKGEAELKDGDELKLGPLCFRVKLIPTPATPSNADTVSDKLNVTLSDTNTQKKLAGVPTGSGSNPALKKLPTSPTASTEEDDIAELLFNLEGDESAKAANIPAGTTIMQPIKDETEEMKENMEASASESSETKPDTKVKQKVPDSRATSDAAKAILDKYMRRPRP